MTRDKIVIAAGQTRDIQLELDLTARGPELENDHLSIMVWPQMAGSMASHHGWEIKGRVKKLLRFSPRRLDIESPLISGEPCTPNIVRLSAPEYVTRIHATCPTRLATVQVLPDKDQAHTHQMAIRFKDDLAIGALDFDISVECYNKEQRKLATLRYPVKGRVVPSAEVVPDVVAFPASSVGSVLEDTVVVQSRTPRRFSVERIATSHDDISAQAIETTNGSYRIRLHVRTPGEHARIVSFIGRHGDEKALINVPLHVHCLGLDSRR